MRARASSPLLTSTALNVSDATFDAAGDGGALVEQPLDVYTEMSYLLCRLRFVLMCVWSPARPADGPRYRRIVDHVNATRDHDLRTHHKVAQEMDAHIRSFLETLPPFFRASSLDTSTDNSVQDVERIMIQLIGQTRLMRLHRPLLAKGYRDPAFVRRRRCLIALTIAGSVARQVCSCGPRDPQSGSRRRHGAPALC